MTTEKLNRKVFVHNSDISRAGNRLTTTVEAIKRGGTAVAERPPLEADLMRDSLS